MNQEEQAVLNYYIAQLGVFFRKGRDYLRRIAQLYIDSGYVPQYRTYLFQVAREENRKPESVRGTTIRHFLQRSWEQGFAPEWRHYLGWNESYPPQVMEAVQLICESYSGFVKQYGQQKKKGTITIDIERIDTQRKARMNKNGQL